MLIKKRIIIFLLFFNVYLSKAVKNKSENIPNVTTMKISKEEGYKMYEDWMNKAFASILSAYLQAKINSKELPREQTDNFLKCFSNIESLPVMSKCVNKILDNKRILTKRFLYYKKSKKTIGEIKEKLTKKALFSEEREVKEVRRRPNYTLSEARRTNGLSPVGGLARLLMANILKQNNQTEIKSWRKTVEEIKQLKELTEKNKLIFKSSNIFGQKDENSPKNTKINKLINNAIKMGIRLTEINNGKENKNERNINLLSPRFLSLTPNKNTNKANFFLNFEFSASSVPKTKFSNLLSPSLFSLHNEGKGLEKELSLPNILKTNQSSVRDQQEWLNLIMESSGINQQINEIKKIFSSSQIKYKKQINDQEIEKRYENQFKGLHLTRKNIYDLFGDYEERKISTWEELNKRFNEKQHQDLDQIGYSILNKDQLKLLYGPKSPFNDSKSLERLLPIIDSYTINQKDIKTIAKMDSFNIRQHDVVLTPSAFKYGLLIPIRASQPFILSPFLFAPTVLSPSVFGALILSPKLFSPTVLAPRVFGPLILNPLGFSPIILSPIALSPFILSPGMFHSTILTPYIFTPLILSPFFIGPVILSPSALSPLILSPFALNPTVMSPKLLSGLLLSPYAFSPVLWSHTYHYAVILSPSLMS